MTRTFFAVGIGVLCALVVGSAGLDAHRPPVLQSRDPNTHPLTVAARRAAGVERTMRSAILRGHFEDRTSAGLRRGRVEYRFLSPSSLMRIRSDDSVEGGVERAGFRIDRLLGGPAARRELQRLGDEATLAERRRRFAQLGLLLFGWAHTVVSLEISGATSTSAELTGRNGFRARLEVNAASGRVDRLLYEDPLLHEWLVVEVDNWRAVGAATLPFAIRRIRAGTVVESIDVESYVLDAGLTADDFLGGG